jgi:hypothetical protein
MSCKRHGSDPVHSEEAAGQVQQRLEWNDFFLQEIMEKARSSMKPLTGEWVGKAEGDFGFCRKCWCVDDLG